MWSSSFISWIRAISCIFLVNDMSSFDGVTLPDGWLCTHTMDADDNM